MITLVRENRLVHFAVMLLDARLNQRRSAVIGQFPSVSNVRSF